MHILHHEDVAAIQKQKRQQVKLHEIDALELYIRHSDF